MRKGVSFVARSYIRRSFKLLAFCVLSASLLLPACNPIPGRQLSSAEKVADLTWMFSIFEQNYAPLEYKQKLFKFDYEKIKQQYIRRAKATANNQEFYELLLEFVSQFKDAHTSATLTASASPGRVQLAYLGFSGQRYGDQFVVTKLSNLVQYGSRFPINVGDVITHINGMPIAQYTLKHMAKFRDLGQDEANLTYHMNSIFNRLSIQNGLPKERDIVLTVYSENSDNPREIKLPWVVQDLRDFLAANSTANANESQEEPNEHEEYDDPSEEEYTEHTVLKKLLAKIDPVLAQRTLNVQLFDNLGRKLDLNQYINGQKQQSFLHSFALPPSIGSWVAGSENDGDSTNERRSSSLDLLRTERAIPSHAIDVTGASEFPAYIVSEDKVTASGRVSSKKILKGYIRIPTFSPSEHEEVVLAGIKETIHKFRQYGVKDIVIDLMDNGGGSLSLVYQMAQAFSRKKIQTHKIQYALNESWLDSLERGQMSGPSPAERELFRRLHHELMQEKNAGKRLSSARPIEEILPFELNPNEELDTDFNIVLLTNEMCASAADIFASLIKYNKMGVLMGKRTMGAGGNVVSYMFDQAPNSHVKLRQTESLLVNPDGTYIENVGIAPHYSIDTSRHALNRYNKLMKEAFHLLNDKEAFKQLLNGKKLPAHYHSYLAQSFDLDCDILLK